MTDASDEQLMERYRDGDAAAFDPLYGRHKGGLYRFMLRQCGNRAVADELFQDVWMNLIRARSGYTVQARFTTWLYRIAHNRLIDHWRSQSSHAPTAYDHRDHGDDGDGGMEQIDAGRASDPSIQAEARDQARRMLGWIDALPTVQREAFLMQQEADMSVAQIAEATGVPIETAKSRLRYAISRLRAARAQDESAAPAAPDAQAL